MSCCPKPKTGPDFDPEFEGPSQADLDRFGSDEYDPRELEMDLGIEQEPSMKKRVILGLGGALAVGAIWALLG